MDLTFSEEEIEFRDELRDWLGSNPAGEEPRGDQDAAFEFRKEWQNSLFEGGWAAVHWPREYGGRDASLMQSAIFFEEMGRANAPLPANGLGLILAGPTIIAWGSDQQKDRFLLPILSAEEIWCQGFSEPEAGSDLAAVKTKAVQDGDEWVVTGQKVWTSVAQYSKWCMLVARTDPEAAKHKGLSYFLMDMEQDAVQVRPLVQITGEAEFNELFLEEARIPADNMLGGEGDVPAVALTTLMNERSGLGFFLQTQLRRALDRLVEDAKENGQIDDPVVAQALGEMHVRTETLRLLAYRGLSIIEQHGQPGPEGSLTKWLWSETNQMLTQLAVGIRGANSLTEGDPWAYDLLRSRGNSIEGGTTEILKNIVAERVLGLPRK
ncbi:MAG: acyl-CoA dehydrogenase family protein [Solirubrobacterales bacterium]